MLNRIDKALLWLQYDWVPRTRPAQAVFGYVITFALIILAVCLAGACIAKLAVMR
jgi:hypothetical protein